MTEIAKILDTGIPVFGTKEKGLYKKEALYVIEKCLTMNIPILGGDVGENVDGFFEHNYDNWSCDKLPKETFDEYSVRSAKKAKEYILKYKSNTALFILVFFLKRL